MESLPFQYQFESERFQRYLDNHPELAAEYAISYFEDYLAVLHQYQKLQARHDQLENELIQLRSQKFPSLPSFLSRNRK